jgi:hypothetical protein
MPPRPDPLERARDAFVEAHARLGEPAGRLPLPG